MNAPLAFAQTLEAHAAEGRGIGAFNVVLLEHAEAIVAAAKMTRLTVVLQISQNCIAYHGGLAPILRACREIIASTGAPALLHLDHIVDAALVREGVRIGVDSVMFDASTLEYVENTRLTRVVADYCHDHGVAIEAELGEVGGKDGVHSHGARTDPAEAARFVAETGVDALAVAVGTSHAMQSRTAAVDHELVRDLAAAVDVPLVLHGSSGLDDGMLQAAVVDGMTKINMATDLTPSLHAQRAGEPGGVGARYRPPPLCRAGADGRARRSGADPAAPARPGAIARSSRHDRAMTQSAVLGVDVGGTTIKARHQSDAGAVLGEWRTPTPRRDSTGEATAAAIDELLDRARESGPVRAIGLAVPGIVTEDAGICHEAVNLGWRDVPIRDIVRDLTGLPVALGHDVRTGALAEAHSGAAAGTRDTVAFIPIGTGIATALVVDGVPLTGREWSGEMGQSLIVAGPFAGRRVEEITSAGGIAARAGEANALIVAERAVNGDPTARAIWGEAVSVLAAEIAHLVDLAEPRLIIIGGGLALADSQLFDPLRSEVEALVGVARRPALTAAVHGDLAAMIGAVQLARRVPA